jgi:AraC-like DNA-binding protein
MAKILPLLRQFQARFPSLKRYGLAVEHFPRYRNLRNQPHSLDVVLLSVIVRGRGRHILGNEVHRESGGSVAVTHYGQEHDIVTTPAGMEIYNVYLDLRHHPLPVLPAPLRPILSAILPIHPRLQHHLNRRVWIRIDRPERLAVHLKRIAEEMKSTAPGALEIVQHSFQIFLIEVCRAAQRHGLVPSRALSAAIPGWVENLRQDLDREFAAPHTLRDLAKRAGVSVAYLCQVFKNYTGKSVVAYLVERRIQAAIWRLRENNDKILSIALECGFNDLAYFNRVFKRITAMTPSQYRRSIRG